MAIKRSIQVHALILLLAFTSACAEATSLAQVPTRAALYTRPPNLMPTLPPEWTKTPYRSPTATHTRLPTATPSSTPTPPPTPTPTNTPLPGERAIIGYSIAGRPLEMYQYGSGPIERLIIAGIHGGYEWNTIALTEHMMLYLYYHPEAVPPDVTLYILRSLNPDGEARARAVSGQMNENGVDLNRNWPSANWMPDWPRSGCWVYRPVTGGPFPLSEPETRALADFILQHHIDASISYHSAALGIFAGGLDNYEPSLQLAEAVAAIAPYPYPPIDTGCLYTGQFSDWMAEQGIAALDIELTNHRDTDYEININILYIFLNWRR